MTNCKAFYAQDSWPETQLCDCMMMIAEHDEVFQRQAGQAGKDSRRSQQPGISRMDSQDLLLHQYMPLPGVPPSAVPPTSSSYVRPFLSSPEPPAIQGGDPRPTIT